MKIEIIRQRRKTIGLKVLNSGSAILKAPLRMSEKEILNFLNNKKNWMEKVCQQMQKREEFARSFDFVNKIYFFGKEISSAQNLILNWDKLNSCKKFEMRDRYYKNLFVNLEDLAQKLSELTGMRFNQLKMARSVRIWGSFSSQGVLRLNFKLIALPKHLVEYVIIHELCHSRFMNHSALFWKEVQKYCPNFKIRKKQLNDFGFILNA